MRSLSQTIQSLSQLGDYLLSFPEELQAVMEIARQENGWFDIASQKTAITNIAQQFLQQEVLREFASQYDLPVHEAKEVAIIMAGNIPLVGFYDLLCVLLSGHKAIVKLSSKDNKLMKAVVLKLQSIDEDLKNDITIVEDQLTSFDAVIATGSNNSARYFEEYFGSYPNIIRKNRNSVAILDGTESKEELRALCKDIFEFYGLGCRNVSKLFVPANYDFIPLLTISNEFSDRLNNNKFKNNFDYNLTLLILNKIPYLESESLIITEDKSLHSRIAILHYQTYKSLDEVNNWIIEHAEELQVVAGKQFSGFGEAQSPAIDDFADNIDTMKFLQQL